MYNETPAQLVAHLTHPNGWWRDMAQRLLVLKQDKSVVPALRADGAAPRTTCVARFHAMWTLEGLGALDAGLVRDAMKDKSPRMRVQAIRASETLYKAGDKSFADDYRALTKDPDPNVVIQAMLSASLFKLAGPGRSRQGGTGRQPGQRCGAHRRAPARAPAARLRRRPSRRAAHARTKRSGCSREATSSARSASRVTDPMRMGAPLEGAPPGTMMAPPLAGSPRVQGHRDYVIKVLLEGADRSARRQDLPRRDGADGRHRRVDRRNRIVPAYEFRQQRWSGHACRRRASPRRDGVSQDSVDGARARRLAAASARFAAVEADCESGAETAVGGATLRGWTSGVPQAPDMWFAVELPQPTMVTELQFDSMTLSPRQGRGGPAGRRRVRKRLVGGDQLPPCRHRPSAILAATACRSRQTARLGVKPVAQGKGDGPHTTITFAPVRAKFVRITQTETVSDAPAWSIRNLRIFEAPGGPATK